MTLQIDGFDMVLDTKNPETPKFVNPITGEGQRAGYTDVLLMLLIDRVDKLIESNFKQEKLIDRVDELVESNSKQEKLLEKTAQEAESIRIENAEEKDKDDEKAESSTTATKRTSSRKKTSTGDE